MSLFGWLKHKLLGTAPARDVSRLHQDADRLDTLSEEIDLSGGPLKPSHRRRALRDRRLLPKADAPVRLGKRKRLFETKDAARLFSATLLTRNRQLRDLATDEEQLNRLGLPVWRTEHEVAGALGLTIGQFWHYATHRQRERVPHYITFAIKKRSGGERLIMAPKCRLKAIQRQLLATLVDKLPVTDFAHGFRRGRNIRTGAEAHVGRRVVVHLDLQDFFPTVTFGRVRGYLIACGYGYPIATALATIMTEAQRQPVAIEDEVFHVPVGERHCVQGAPTSPGLCNAIVAKLDRRLGGLARKFGVAYSRYADDLTFSGDIDDGTVGRLLHHATAIVAAEGFKTNAAKTRVMHAGGPQRVTGVTVNRVVGLSRRERRQLRAAVHHLVRGPARDPANVVRGKLAYVAMLNREQAATLLRYWSRLTGGASPAAMGAPPDLPTSTPAATADLAPASGEAPAFAGRRFEHAESAKFWAIAANGSEVTIVFGRIGERGQRQTKAFTSPAAAARERDRLIASMLDKGYVERT